MEYKFKIYEIRGKNKLEVGSGKDKEAIEREAQHYAMQYSQDGPVEIWRSWE